MQTQVSELTIEYQTNLFGTDITNPRFSWIINSEVRNASQTAYQIQISQDEDDFLSIFWDSGKVLSEESIQIEYAGPPVSSRTRYYIRVKVWDQMGYETNWSEIKFWETSLLSSDEWKAKWITAHPDDINPLSREVFMLRKEFKLEENIKSARIYSTAAGLYELNLNGKRVGTDLLAPGWTSYHHRLQYQTYDITEHLQPSSSNVIGILLGDGWFKGDLMSSRHTYGDFRSVILQMHIKYENGLESIIGTDTTWRANIGPILFSEIYHGEIYDSRKEINKWDQVGLDDSQWSRTIDHSWRPQVLVAQENWPCRVTESLKPISVIHTPSGDRLLDMGQNMVGRMKFTIDIPKDSKVVLNHAEVLDKNGNFYTGNLKEAMQQIEYFSNGIKTTYTPHFTFQGFRYVKVKGLSCYTDEELMDIFIGEVIHSDMKSTGFFECSDSRVNQLQHNIIWSQRGNFVDVPTDCPQRNERVGWTGDAQVFIGTALFNFHGGPFFRKWLHDVSADQLRDGSIPVIVPDVLPIYSSSAWGDASTIVPWSMYQRYADKRILVEQYDSMKKWVDYIMRQGENEYLWNTGFHLGDWLALDAKENSYEGATPKDFIATAFFANSVRIVRDTAKIIGKYEDASFYGEVLERIIEEFNSEFVSRSGRILSPTQTAHVLVLAFNLVSSKVRKRTAKELNRMIVANNYHLTTGFVGTPYLCLALSENGYHDTAVKLLLQDDYPSWLYSISKGATTIWEHWDSIKSDGSFWSDEMNSFNHYAYGAIGEWLYRKVAGLELDEVIPGYKMIHIRPQLGLGEFTHAKASFLSPYGEIKSSWALNNNTVNLKVSIPVNTTAKITIPSIDITENGLDIKLVEGVQSVISKDSSLDITIGSGDYCFTFDYTPPPKRITESTLVTELSDNVTILDQYLPEILKEFMGTLSIGELVRQPGVNLSEEDIKLLLERLNNYHNI